MAQTVHLVCALFRVPHANQCLTAGNREPAVHFCMSKLRSQTNGVLLTLVAWVQQPVFQVLRFTNEGEPRGKPGDSKTMPINDRHILWGSVRLKVTNCLSEHNIWSRPHESARS